MKELSYKMFFKALSNKTRFEIIQLLRKKPLNVTGICKELGFEQSRISHNLRSLEACGFVTPEWDGKSKVYSLDREHIVPILEKIDKYIERYGERLRHCGILRGKRTCIHAPREV